MKPRQLLLHLIAISFLFSTVGCPKTSTETPNKTTDEQTDNTSSNTDGKTAENTASTPDAPFREQAPSPGKAPEVSPPKAESFTLKNGLEVVLIERKDLPLVSSVLLIHSGSAQNPKGKAGLASFTAAMLDEGTKTRNAFEIADEMELLGMALGINSNADSFQLSMSTLSETFDASMALFSDIVRNPTFDTKEIERVRKDRITTIQQQKDQPRAMANYTFANVVYGPTHPYGLPETGTENSVKKLSKRDLQRFHKTYFVPQNASLVFVGNLDRASAEAKVKEYFGAWKGKKVKTKTPTRPKSLAKTKVYLVDKEKAPQSTLRIGLVGIERSNPDYQSVQVMNYILGGSFSSRLNLNLREDKGWSYGARSTFANRKGAGPFLAYAEVQSDHTADSVGETLKEMQKMIDQEITDEELAFAKSAISQSLLGAFETNGATAGTFANLLLYNLPIDYYEAYASRVNAITKADVKRVAQKYLKPGNLAIVVVGPKEQVEKNLSRFGEVEMRGPYGEKL